MGCFVNGTELIRQRPIRARHKKKLNRGCTLMNADQTSQRGKQRQRREADDACPCRFLRALPSKPVLSSGSYPRASACIRGQTSTFTPQTATYTHKILGVLVAVGFPPHYFEACFIRYGTTEVPSTRLTVTAVPDPAAFALGAFTVGAGVLRRRRSN